MENLREILLDIIPGLLWIGVSLLFIGILYKGVRRLVFGIFLYFAVMGIIMVGLKIVGVDKGTVFPILLAILALSIIFFPFLQQKVGEMITRKAQMAAGRSN